MRGLGQHVDGVGSLRKFATFGAARRLSPWVQIYPLRSNLMKRTSAIVAFLAYCLTCSATYGLYTVEYRGAWPNTWPKELESVRKQATTLVGPMVESRHYLIPFTQRDQFEAAWPQFLKVKSKGAPIVLVRGPKTDFFEVQPAGVLIHSPPAGNDTRVNPEVPIAGITGMERWMNVTYIELVVDGDIVDLNRIPLPSDTPIIDERFKQTGKPGARKIAASTQPSGNQDALTTPPATSR